jgi:glycosyltransferase involved in cell wall biosynthesis
MGDSALRSAGRLGVPLVLTYHTLWNRYAEQFRSATATDLVVNLSVEYANLCDCVVAPSRSLADRIAAMSVAAPVEVVPTGISLPLFSNGNRTRGRKLIGLGGNERLAGYVGRVGPEKNLAWLSNAAAQWCAGDARARFAVVGPSDAYGPALREAFEDAGMANRLLLPGSFTGAGLADVYAALDVFTFASLSDTQGIVLAEATAAGLPIVALDAPGAREAVDDGSNGRLLPANCERADFVRALTEIFADDDRRRSMSEAAKRRAPAYDRTLTARRMLGLYESLLANPRRRAYDERRGVLDRLLGRLEAERKLLAARTAATVDAVSGRHRHGTE